MAESGDFKELFAREGFKGALVPALSHHLDKIVRELLVDGHKLRYAGPGKDDSFFDRLVKRIEKDMGMSRVET